MDQDITFSYNYSAKENKEIQEIRQKYLPHKESSIEELRRLDAKVKRPSVVFGIVFGSISAIVMGSGMSLVMTDIAEKAGIADPMLCGIIIGLAGMIMAIINYPIYKGILGSRRKKYADKIIALSDQMMKG